MCVAKWVVSQDRDYCIVIQFIVFMCLSMFDDVAAISQQGFSIASNFITDASYDQPESYGKLGSCENFSIKKTSLTCLHLRWVKYIAQCLQCC